MSKNKFKLTLPQTPSKDAVPENGTPPFKTPSGIE